MTRRRLIAAVTAALAGAALLTPPAHARPLTDHAITDAANVATDHPIRVAPPTPPPPNPWPWPQICTEAAFTHYSVHQSGAETAIGLSGWIQPCPGENDPGAMRSFTLYYTDEATRSRYIWPLLDPYSKTYTFGVSGTSTTPPTAICIIDGISLASPNAGTPGRRACLGIDQTDTGFVVTPIPITDPRVQAQLQIPSNRPPLPFCGTCI